MMQSADNEKEMVAAQEDSKATKATKVTKTAKASKTTKTG